MTAHARWDKGMTSSSHASGSAPNIKESKPEECECHSTRALTKALLHAGFLFSLGFLHTVLSNSAGKHGTAQLHPYSSSEA